MAKKFMGFEDPNHEGNSTKYHTGKKCIEQGCKNPAGTMWGKLWCFEHNVERMKRIDAQFNELEKQFGIGKKQETSANGKL